MSASNYLLESDVVAHSDDIWALKYTSAGVVTGSADGTLKLWNPSSPEEAVCTMTPSPRQGKRPLAVVGLDAQKNTPRCEFAISCTLDSAISRFSMREENAGKEEASYVLPSAGSKGRGQAWNISLHPDPSRNLFATSGVGGTIRILSAAVENFGEEKMQIPSRGQFAVCTYSPDGRILASATSEGQIALYDAETGQLLQFWQAHEGYIRTITFSPDSSLLISGGDDKQINVFDVRGMRTSKDAEADGYGARSSNGGNMRSRHSSKGHHVANLAGHTGWVLSLAPRSDGRVFASSSSDGTIKLWDMARPSSAVLSTLREHETDVWAVDWAPMPPSHSAVEGISGGGLGGGRLVSGGKDGQLKWWKGTG